MLVKLFGPDNIIIQPKNGDAKGHYIRMGKCPEEMPNTFGMTARQAIDLELVTATEYKCHHRPGCTVTLQVPETLEVYVKQLVAEADGNLDVRIFWSIFHPNQKVNNNNPNLLD